MALTALLVAQPEYRAIFPNTKQGDNDDSVPGVRNLQVWMKDAWAQGKSCLCLVTPSSIGLSDMCLCYCAGYDQQGREQLKGEIVGTKKWIGTSGRSATSNLHNL